MPARERPTAGGGPGPPGAERSDFALRRLEKPEEFRAAGGLASAAGAGLGEDPVAPSLLRTLQDNGGVVLGAFADVHLAGLSVAYLGWDGTALYLYSQLTAVRPEYRNHALARRLKLRQREIAMSAGLAEIRFAFDPLESPQAALNVRRLGATPDRYLSHYFGRTGGSDDPGAETDRLRVVWRLQDPEVEARLREGPPARPVEEELVRRATPIVETEVGSKGLRSPSAVAEPSGAPAHLEIPFDLALLREHEPGGIRSWRHAVRDGFRAAFDLGYRVAGFAVVPIEHERRSFYLWRAPTPAVPAAR